MSDWINEFGRRKVFIVLFVLLSVIGASVIAYVDYHLNHVVFDNSIYSLDGFHDGSWHFISDTGKTFTVKEETNKDYVHILSNITMTINKERYDIKSEINYGDGRLKKSDHVRYVVFDGKKVDATSIYVAIESMEDNLFIPMILIFILVNSFTCVSLLYPRLLWKVNMLFVSRGGEPTDFYIATARLIGISLWCITVFKSLNMV